MSDDAIRKLLAKAPFSFVGTVQRVGAATLSGHPIDNRTSIVSVDEVLHSPPAFARSAGTQITLQLASDVDPPAAGAQMVFFAESLAFGPTMALQEVGRLPVSAAQAHLTRAATTGTQAFGDVQAEIALADLRKRAAKADAVVVGRVVKLDRPPGKPGGEHDPEWWRATVELREVVRGKVTGRRTTVLYANSRDVRWRDAPKLHAGETALLLLQATPKELAKAAPFQILHEDDRQPVQMLEHLSGKRG